MPIMSSEDMGKMYRLGSANYIKSKANWAYMQTSEFGRTRTIISVNADEALVILWALEEYIDKYRKMIEIQEMIERKEINEQQV